MEGPITHRVPGDAFNDAINRDVLRLGQYHPRYAGLYMYMFTQDGVDFFKHTQNRKYLRSDAGPLEE